MVQLVSIVNGKFIFFIRFSPPFKKLCGNDKLERAKDSCAPIVISLLFMFSGITSFTILLVLDLDVVSNLISVSFLLLVGMVESLSCISRVSLCVFNFFFVVFQCLKYFYYFWLYFQVLHYFENLHK